VSPQSPAHPEPAVETAETHQRFRRLRLLIGDPPRRQRLIFGFSLLSLAAVSLMAYLIDRFPASPFDLAPTRALQGISNALFLQLMVAISLFGFLPWSAITVTGGVLLASVLLGWKDGAYLLLLTAVQAVANLLIKRAVGRPRPLNTLVDVFMPVSGDSFPSGHVMFYTVFFGFLLFLALTRLPRSFWRASALILTGGLIVSIGPSRMYLGAHWLSDVIAAYLFGVIILAFGIEFYLRDLAPRAPTQQGGVIGAHDQAVRSAEEHAR
jgi:membrane-associated phospholipid phosphatase